MLLGCLTSGQARADEEWLPDLELVQGLESTLKMPDGAGAVTEYARYYSAEPRGTHRAVIGIFLQSREPGVYIVRRDRLPIAADGGCGIVNVVYDVETGSIVAAYCNGGL